MKKGILKNGVRFIYEKRDTGISSFCIGFDAGAIREENAFKYGTAHALEHMLYKGTLKRSENEINKMFDEIFGFNNAMTNYPYVIYYGTALTADFEKGLELYSDILLNPAFCEKGFKEELSVIGEELRDWQEDLTQYCEDMLFYHSFDKRRLKERIIGSAEDVKSAALEELKEFYYKYYVPSNCVISIVTGMEYQDAYNLTDKYFGGFEAANQHKLVLKNNYQYNRPGTFIDEFRNSTGARLQYCFPIHELSKREVKVLSLFNFHFGESVTSILYDEIRTRRGLVYEVKSKVVNETGIKLFTISASTSIENVNAVKNIINSIIEGVKYSHTYDLDPKRINNIIGMLKIRRELLLEKSIQLSKELTCYELMYNSPEEVYSEFEELRGITTDEIHKVILKTFGEPSIQILK